MSTKPSNQSVKLTKTVVEKCPLPPTGQAFLRDAQLPGFALRLTAGGTRAFIVEKRIHGRVRRITLGRFGELTVEEARCHAKITLGKIAFGTDPLAEKRVAQLKALTLGEVYREFVKARKPHLKPRTLYDYDLLMRGVFKDWQSKPITDIRKTQVSQRHRDLGVNRGEAYANQAMRFLRAVLNFAQPQYDDRAGHSLPLGNPVRVLTRTRSWYRLQRRRTVIKSHISCRLGIAVWRRCGTRRPPTRPTRWPIICCCLFSPGCAARKPYSCAGSTSTSRTGR